MKDRIGEMLLRAGIIDEDQLEKAADFQKSQGGKVSSALVRLNFLDEDDLLEFLSRQLGLPTVSLDEIDVDPEAVKMIPGATAQKYMCIPYGQVNSSLHVAMADPTDLNAIDDIKFMTNLAVEVSIATESQIRKALDQFYDTGMDAQEVLDEFQDDDMESVDMEDGSQFDGSVALKAAEDAPVVKLVNYVLREAINRKASDIHVEPYEKVFRVRLRIDGALSELLKPPLKLKNAVVSRLKIMSRLDIAERRLPQDGRIKLKLGKGRDM
ncbi:MAG: Flp pilus assembly complex ATPase component TadA, partial [Deltaproteobacteria bacterium]|nr:Flp pilus assembly complex ATPase component TadA [Deltaproteobacteria bacterium]